MNLTGKLSQEFGLTPMRKMSRALFVKPLIMLGTILCLGHMVWADDVVGLSDAKIRTVVESALDRFDTPGMAVGIVQNGKVRHLKGYGVRDIAGPEKVNADTLFSIASTTKAFTSTALAILVDEGKLDWDDPVVKYLPDFRLADPWVTREFTVRDLLTHRSGLGRGAGDLMLWPEPAGFTREEIIHNLRYLKIVTSFRSEYAYDNLLYIVAGEVVAAISGRPWETFVQTRILNPLGMACFSGSIPASSLKNVATPHGSFDGKMATIPRNAITGDVKASAAAGGLVCNVRGMSKWMIAQLQGGVGPNGERIFSLQQRDEMWRSQTILKVSSFEREYDNTHFKTYALAWRKTDVLGYEVVSHTGTLSGMQAYLTLVPELDLGLMVLSNGSNYGARSSVTQAIIKSFMSDKTTDWIEKYHQRQITARTGIEEEQGFVQGSGQMEQSLENYLGSYLDTWFGAVAISQVGDSLRFISKKSVQMRGDLEPFENNTFIVRWDNRTLEADAYVYFDEDVNGENIMTMKAVSANTDSSFDFPDLRFVREE